MQSSVSRSTSIDPLCSILPFCQVVVVRSGAIGFFPPPSHFFFLPDRPRNFGASSGQFHGPLLASSGTGKAALTTPVIATKLGGIPSKFRSRSSQSISFSLQLANEEENNFLAFVPPSLFPHDANDLIHVEARRRCRLSSVHLIYAVTKRT